MSQPTIVLCNRPTIEIALPPVYTPYRNPSLGRFVRAHGTRGKNRTAPGARARGRALDGSLPAAEIVAGKNTPIYRLHSYHTKVPPQGIAPFIARYSRPGEIVLDPFCGSGMTGLAALGQKRRAILCDLSPAATFMSLNYCYRTSPDRLRQAADRITERLRDEAEWYYETRCQCGRSARVEYYIWSERFRCRECRTIFRFSEGGIDRQGRARQRLSCPRCGTAVGKQAARRVDFVPVAKSLVCSRCGRLEASVSRFDQTRLREINLRDQEGTIWYPTDRMMHAHASEAQWGELWRKGYHYSISHVHDFFTPRARLMLGLVWREICEYEDESLRRPLAQSFLDIVRLVSRLRAPTQGRPTHTLYVPSLNKEANVLSTFARKTAAAAKLPPSSISQALDHHLCISTQSATDLGELPDESIDYVFTDPPFGANLVYSELNFLEESWIGLFMNQDDEVIIAPAHSKDVTWYRGMMQNALAEIHRVLKPGRVMTLIFHNSSARVWQAIQYALGEVGFYAEAIATFDKKHRSFKQVTAPNAVGYDVVVNCRKDRSPLHRRAARRAGRAVPAEQHTLTPADEQIVIRFLSTLPDVIHSGSDDMRNERRLYSKMVAYCIETGYRVAIDFREFRKLLAKHFTDED
ncbi:hypothetical protein AMJ39_05760 [candidate division TA06 bacterium DG_24]|uniref:DNA methylase N-4/N-6 domain-containing protein n=2 Tax=Bacteria division TA06 TaxID=1156500 RepID=A0A0S8G5L5_UNCT6|nr:MAG: hypothetical protein AMJ39_05760 [candidate division TA06 bacterium DG_24]KPK68198.1 MAG: hypothetical protein AMJ82_08855 [candidate division TA06 bacterium SM23_40]